MEQKKKKKKKSKATLRPSRREGVMKQAKARKRCIVKVKGRN
jgi:hypothetical protein